jgi:hypothetical protein
MFSLAEGITQQYDVLLSLYPYLMINTSFLQYFLIQRLKKFIQNCNIFLTFYLKLCNTFILFSESIILKVRKEFTVCRIVTEVLAGFV